MVMAVLAQKWVTNRGWETDPKLTFLEHLGLKKIGAANHRQSSDPYRASKRGVT